jgi:hypothetical protein
MKLAIGFSVAAAILLLAATSASAGPSPNAKLAMHLVATDAYLSCDYLAPASMDYVDDDLTIEELAVVGYRGYALFIAYDLGACIHGVEFFVTGWPMGRGAPPLGGVAFCVDYLMLGEPLEAHGGTGGLAAWVGHVCIWDPITHMAPFGSVLFDVSAHTSYLPISLEYSPSSYSNPDDPYNWVMGPTPTYDEDPVVAEYGCLIGTGGAESIEVLSPNGGEVWYVGSSPPIEWSSPGVENVQLEYSTDGGTSWSVIEAFAPSAGFYLWTIPEETSTQCLVRITDADDGFPSDVSDALFEIRQESGRIVHVPGDWPSIQYGIHGAAPGDTVVVAPGTYYEGLDMKEGVAVRSENGRDMTTIDGTGHLHVVAFELDGTTASVEGFTITGGYAHGPSVDALTGGGVFFRACGGLVRNCIITDNRAGMLGGGVGGYAMWGGVIEDCVISNNISESAAGVYLGGGDTALRRNHIVGNSTTAGWGGGVYMLSTSPKMSECVIEHNTAVGGGGGVYCIDSSPWIRGCTVSHNSAGLGGGGMMFDRDSFPMVENTIIAFSLNGDAVACEHCAYPTLKCCDIFGNAWGPGCASPWIGTSGNFAEDPLFCCPEIGNYHLQSESPCVSSGNCGLIGALGVGCTGPSRVEPVTWSRVKARYRAK